jgi:hypothetical protein
MSMYNELKNTIDNNYTLTVKANRRRRIRGKRTSNANRIENIITIINIITRQQRSSLNCDR